MSLEPWLDSSIPYAYLGGKRGDVFPPLFALLNFFVDKSVNKLDN